VIQQNSAASEEMAATSEELSSQAAVLQSSIAFFKTGEAPRVPSPPVSRRAVASRSAPRKASKANSSAASLSQMQRAVRNSGNQIELDSNQGSADALDHEFTNYEA
jgi:methyl-accepting chemotaxis protein